MSRCRCCCGCNNNRYSGYGCGGYGGYGCGGFAGNSCCNFSCLIVLILILLFFNRNKRCLCGGSDECGEGRCGGLDGGIIFIITLFYLCCCSPCGGGCGLLNRGCGC